MKCKQCDSSLKGRQTKWCSASCREKGREKLNYNTYARQKDLGVKRKKELIGKMGGGCKKCGYNRCIKALEFHHTSNDKSFNLCSRTLGNSSWEKIEAVAKKCVLLCANCHREIHAEMREEVK